MKFLKYILFFLTSVAVAQSEYTVKGYFPQVKNTEITLRGFKAQQEVFFDKTTTDSQGNFSLKYPENYVGAALLEITNTTGVILLLNKENFEIRWKDINLVSDLEFLNSNENSAFDYGLFLYQNTEAKRAGITYLLPYYTDNPQKNHFFTTELEELNRTLPDYLNGLPTHSYAKYYLQIRVLIADLQIGVQRYFEHLPELEKQFNHLDFNDPRLLSSGLYKELLETYFIAIENYGETAPIHINKSIDVIVESLKPDPELKQETAQYLFNLFEKRSLFDNAKHLALTMLTDESCQLDDKHTALFEQYRKMAVGNIAPDITFTLSNSVAKGLSDLKNNYKLIVFGAAWCSKCVEEIPKLQAFYQNWKEKYDLEIVFISLDTQKEDFINFSKDFPWLSNCDLNGWESQPARDYHIFATPTMYLLNKNHQIELKPISAEQVNAWLEWHK
ncbi:MAG: thioredoxin family protein [Flavobacteriaceae bacterium]